MFVLKGCPVPSQKRFKKRSEANGVEMEVLAVSTQQFPDEVKKGYDVSMVAPQIKHRFALLKEAKR